MEILPLIDIFPIKKPSCYKIHFARYEKTNNIEPLDVFVRSREEWQGWQEYKPQRNEFNRPFIFSVIQFYPETDIWLFGGIWEIMDRLPEKYVVSLTNQGQGFIGRLKLHYSHRGRGTRLNFENYVNEFTVSEILREEYTGTPFPGHDWIDISFNELESLIRNDRKDWRGALKNTKGVYLITDTHTERKYVGAAYSDGGIWYRWRDYINTCHGGNRELIKLYEDRGSEYFRKYFRFSLLESHTARIADETINLRESYWKKVLRSRGKQGYNAN